MDGRQKNGDRSIWQVGLLSCIVAGFSSCSRPFPEAGLFSLVTLVSAQNHYIFVTSSTYNGNLLASGGGANGVEGADRLCAASKDADQPFLPGTGGEYRALIANGASRVACTTANCGGGAAEHLNWVLQPNTTYLRPDGVTLFSTNAAGVFGMSGALQAPFSTVSGQRWWTGLDVDWQTAQDCTAWNDGTNGANGSFGVASATGTAALADLFGEFCDSSDLSLLCVRQ